MKLRFVIRTPTHCMKIIQNAVFLIFRLGHFLPSFVRLKVTCHVTLFDRKLQVFKHSPKWTVFGIYNELLSTQNINVARFARNVKCDFFCDFQTLWSYRWINTIDVKKPTQNWKISRFHVKVKYCVLKKVKANWLKVRKIYGKNKKML